MSLGFSSKFRMGLSVVFIRSGAIAKQIKKFFRDRCDCFERKGIIGTLSYVDSR